MNDQQRDFLRDIAKMAAHSALFGAIAGLPRAAQLLIFAAAVAVVLYLLA